MKNLYKSLFVAPEGASESALVGGEDYKFEEENNTRGVEKEVSLLSFCNLFALGFDRDYIFLSLSLMQMSDQSVAS